MKLVVCAETQWNGLVARKQQLLRRFPSDWSILYLQTYVHGRPNPWWPRRAGNVTYATVPTLKAAPTGWLHGVLAIPPLRFAANVVASCWIHAVRVLTGFGGRDVALYVSNIFWGRVLAWMPRRFAVYDCNDNHLAFPGTPGWARGYYERIVRQVDRVVVTSPQLRQEIEHLRPGGIVEIGNGVDFELFDSAWRAPRPPGVISRLPGPRIGYAGALAPWIDFELLAAVAVAFPHASLVLAGPAVGGETHPERHFGALPNVHFLGRIPHEELPQIVMHMDVTLVPFRLTPLTHGVNPNKLYEYFALGKPVVTTDFSPFIDAFAGHLRIARTQAEFVAAIRSLLVAPGDPEPRRDIARRNGWGQAAKRMAALFEELAAGRAQAPGSVPGD